MVTAARFVKWKNGDMDVFAKERFFLRYLAKHFENKITEPTVVWSHLRL